MDESKNHKLLQALLGIRESIHGSYAERRNCHFNVGETLSVIRDAYINGLKGEEKDFIEKTVPSINYSNPHGSTAVWTVDSKEAWRLFTQLHKLLAPEVNVKASNPPSSVKVQTKNKRVFVVHGHDDAAKLSAARFLEKLGLEPIILHEQASQGRTIIEKFEKHSDVSYALVLLTPDDEGRKLNDPKLRPRARQNVVLELGYFWRNLEGSVFAHYTRAT